VQALQVVRAFQPAPAGGGDAPTAGGAAPTAASNIAKMAEHRNPAVAAAAARAAAAIAEEYDEPLRQRASTYRTGRHSVTPPRSRALAAAAPSRAVAPAVEPVPEHLLEPRPEWAVAEAHARAPLTGWPTQTGSRRQGGLAAPSLSALQQPQLAQRHQEADAWLRQRQEERERQQRRQQLQWEQQQRKQQQRDTPRRLPPQMANAQMGRDATPHH
jgi:hypothetical protein